MSVSWISIVLTFPGGREGNNQFTSFKGCIRNLRHNSIVCAIANAITEYLFFRYSIIYTLIIHYCHNTLIIFISIFILVIYILEILTLFYFDQLYDLEIGPRRLSRGATNICTQDSCQSCDSKNMKCSQDKCICKPGFMGDDCTNGYTSPSLSSSPYPYLFLSSPSPLPVLPSSYPLPLHISLPFSLLLPFFILLLLPLHISLPLSLLLPFFILLLLPILPSSYPLSLPPHLLLPLLLAFPLHLYLPIRLHISLFLPSPSSSPSPFPSPFPFLSPYISPSPSSSISAQISPTEAPVIDIQTANSFLQLSLSPSLKTNLTNIHTVQLMFRTRQSNGVIYTMQSFSTLEQFVIEVSIWFRK